MNAQEAHRRKVKRVTAELKQSKNQPVALDKATSNLFRSREATQRKKLNVKDFNSVIEVNTDNQTVEVEGMTLYEDLVAATLKHNCMPAVVPQLKTITIGGAVSGLGIEASSFRYGLVHETVESMDVLTASGEVVTCTATNEHSDLFFAMPNSYGSFGYVLKLTAKTVPVKPYVHVRHIRHTNAQEYFTDIEKQLTGDIDFIDGSIFSPDEMYITIGKFVDEAPFTSDYTFKNIYYRSIQNREEDYLSTHDFIWRWDTDWFWTSKHFYVENPIVRRLFGKERLNSRTYTKIMRWNQKWRLVDKVEKMLGQHSESVIQDVDVPIDKAAEFLDFFQHNIGIKPVWMCPFRHYNPQSNFTLYPTDNAKTYVNFGFWDVIKGKKELPAGHYNKQIEAKLAELGGIKSLYAESFYDRKTFYDIYNGNAYHSLKTKYDPNGVFPGLYEKTVLRK